MTNLFGPLKLRYGVLCLVISLVAALVAYGIGHTLTATYQASGTIRVALVAENGVTDPNVTAANDLASQDAQVVDSTPVEQLTAKALALPPGELSGMLSGSTVAAQNLIRVTASGSSASEATARDAAAVAAVKTYLTTLSAQAGRQYLNAIGANLNALVPYPSSRAKTAGLSVLTASIASQRSAVMAQAVRDVVGNIPNFEVVNATGSASETAPKPELYALIAFVVALIITGRVAFVLARTART